MVEKFWEYLILFLAFSWLFESCGDKTIKESKKVETEAKEEVKINKDKLVEAFICVESEGNPYIVNKHTGATGILQIMPVMINEANRLVGYDKYKLSDRTNKQKSIEMFHLIMTHKNYYYDIALACMIWNPRGGWNYYNKVNNKYNELINRKEN